VDRTAPRRATVTTNDCADGTVPAVGATVITKPPAPYEVLAASGRLVSSIAAALAFAPPLQQDAIHDVFDSTE
jgi:hypothetical protein